jgi:hypothetical protein
MTAEAQAQEQEPLDLAERLFGPDLDPPGYWIPRNPSIPIRPTWVDYRRQP